MKKIAKMIPRNSSSVSVRQTGRFSLAFHGLFHLIRPRSHRRSSATIIRFSTNAMQIPINSGESRSSRLPSTPLIHFRLFSPQYSSAAKAISSMIRLIFFLFRSKAIPPFGRVTLYIIMSCVKFPCKKRRKVENFCEQSGGAYQKYFSLSETPTCILSNHSINCKVTERFFTYGGIPYEAAQPLVYAIVGVIVLLFAGLVYAWSVLSTPIGAEFTGWTKAQLSLTFTLVMILFCIGLPAVRPAGRRLSAKNSRAPGRSPVSGWLFIASRCQSP